MTITFGLRAYNFTRKNTNAGDTVRKKSKHEETEVSAFVESGSEEDWGEDSGEGSESVCLDYSDISCEHNYVNSCVLPVAFQ